MQGLAQYQDDVRTVRDFIEQGGVVTLDEAVAALGRLERFGQRLEEVDVVVVHEPQGAPSQLPPNHCRACSGDGYYKGPRLGDEPCPECKGSGVQGAPQKPEGA
jgi:hypothetical protein